MLAMPGVEAISLIEALEAPWAAVCAKARCANLSIDMVFVCRISVSDTAHKQKEGGD